jgi:hypothetical protein
MGARQCAATDRALRLVGLGVSCYRAAKECGLATSTVYRALVRLQDRRNATHAATLAELRNAPPPPGTPGRRRRERELRRATAAKQSMPGETKDMRPTSGS